MAGYADELFSRLAGREPQIPVEGVKMSRHKMFVESDKAATGTGLQAGESGSGAGARGALVRGARLHCESRGKQSASTHAAAA